MLLPREPLRLTVAGIQHSTYLHLQQRPCYDGTYPSVRRRRRSRRSIVRHEQFLKRSYDFRMEPKRAYVWAGAAFFRITIRPNRTLPGHRSLLGTWKLQLTSEPLGENQCDPRCLPGIWQIETPCPPKPAAPRRNPWSSLQRKHGTGGTPDRSC